LRSAIEATIRSLKLPFRNDQLPVRGRFRVAVMIIASAAIVNLHRIHRYQVERRQPAGSGAAALMLNINRSLDCQGEHRPSGGLGASPPLGPLPLLLRWTSACLWLIGARRSHWHPQTLIA